MKKVYIIILNYNNWKDTVECLESVLRNDYPNYQVIVVDNDSSDGSLDYIKAWAEGKLNIWVRPDHPLRYLSFPPVKKPVPYVYYTRAEAEAGGKPEIEDKLSNPLIFIQTGRNLGFAGGNNVGIRYVMKKGDFDSVILLNNDTVIKKNAITELVKAKNSLGNGAIYGGRIYYYSQPNKVWYNGGYFNEWLGRAIHIDTDNVNITKNPVQEVNFITFCYVLIPKEIIEKIGLLDEAYFMYLEDVDYSYRVWEKGYKLFHVTTSHIYHKVGASSGGEFSSFSTYWYYRNSLKLRLKRIKGIKKYISTGIYFLGIPWITMKWFFKKKEILPSIYKGIIDGILK